jgi:serine/threonine protein kinase
MPLKMNQPDDPMIDQPFSTGPADEAMPPSLDSAAELASILDRYMAELRAGRAPARQQLCEAYPELASQLEACLAGIEFIHRATGPATDTPTTLGEFRIIRELGRGGMGVVYEAEQSSLRRHVALKVLRFGVVADQDAMNRFRREAETVARLHHTNIVPIFAVGCEHGVHYYAMQFIEGRSLADVLAESQRTGTPLSFDEVAHWGLEAAEALAHAHQRGVIHRDIKPSNLLLDADGVVWLTDFGLAKRMDEATLTVHGTLMGTPRYMSPEQAASLRQPVDRRTDLYSLGASLYELATGKPVFASAMPHVVIAQILTEEPARPRQIRPALPRDLETVILTCLAKEPGKRYQSADALASDLRAVIEGRSIQARRVPPVERLVRYVRQRRKTLRGAGVVAAATVLLMIGAFGAWRYYSAWRLGHVVLTTSGPALTTVVLPASGDEPIAESFDVGTHATVSLPAGDYRLRVQGAGLVGQTYRLAVNRGESRSYRLTLDKNSLMNDLSIPYPLAGDAMMLKRGKADLIEWTGQTLLRRDLSKGQAIWNAALAEEPSAPGHDSFAWMQRLALVGGGERPGTLVNPAPDLDGDGTGDVIMAFARTPSILAVSGRDGSMLWAYSATLDGRGGPDPLGPDELAKAFEETDLAGGGKRQLIVKGGRVIESPAPVEIDGDGVSDLLALFFVFDDPTGTAFSFGVDGSVLHFEKLQPGRRVIAAISGRTGRALWSRTLDSTTMSRPWLWDRLNRWSATPLPFDAVDSEIAVVPGRKGPIIAQVVGSQWTELDPTTGQTRGQPIEFGFVPGRPVQYADLDGDGAPEMLALGPSKAGYSEPPLVAVSFATGQRLWAERVTGYHTPQAAIPAREWPLVEDLDGDGRAEVVIPDFGALPPRNFANYEGLRLLDGATGQTRWTRPMRPSTGWPDGLAHLIAGPDLDGDGTRDVVAVSRYDGRNPGTYFMGRPLDRACLYVDALSGTNGHPLWWWHEDVTDFKQSRIWAPSWWGCGPDGWPMLVVPLGGKVSGEADPTSPLYHPMPPVTRLLEASTGRTLRTIESLSWPKLADLDGDGLEDLWGSVDDKLRAFRAEPPEAWRSLDELVPAGDLDGDGLADVMTVELSSSADFEMGKLDKRTAVARSGSDGHLLWTATIDDVGSSLNWESWLGPRSGTRSTLSTFPVPGGDFDGDGAPEVIVVTREEAGAAVKGTASLPIQVLSGRSGRRLWRAGSMPPLGFDVLGYQHVEGIAVCNGHAAGTADLLVVYDTPFARGRSISFGSHSQQTHLSRLSGRDGRVVWDILLAEHKAGISKLMGFEHAFGDLDGDGGLDVVLRTYATSTPGPTAFELRAVSFRDGKNLWAHPIRDLKAAFAVGDLDGDGRAEAIVSDQPAEGSLSAVELTAIEGRNGATRWTWTGDDVRDPSSKNPALYLADFDGKGRRQICLSFGVTGDSQRVAIVDARGQEHASRDRERKPRRIEACCDLDGDGRDELLLHESDRLYACWGDLGQLWSRPNRESVHQVIPAHAGQPATVVLSSMVAIDGATGHTLWKGNPSQRLLDPGSSGRLPRTLTADDDATFCSLVLAATPEGTYKPARGTRVPPGLAGDDPRWGRPLPWSRQGGGMIPPLVFLGVGGLAMINVVVPFMLVRLATRRRFWGIPLLMALPAVVAIPLAVFMTFLSVTPSLASASVMHAVTTISLATLGGLPVVVYVVLLTSSLLCRRWGRFVRMAVLSVLAALGLGVLWLRTDSRTMPTIEHYTWSGWHTLIFPGIYTAGVLVIVAWAVRGTARFAFTRFSQHSPRICHGDPRS